MPIVKINIHKLHAERSLKAKAGQVNINNNVSLSNVEQLDFSVEGKKGLKFTFEFSCNYEPDLGKIEVEGQVLYVGDEAEIDDVKKSWDKNKRIPYEVMEKIVNAALHKGNIQAIKISEEVNLPSPLPLPKVKPGPAAEEKKKK